VSIIHRIQGARQKRDDVEPCQNRGPRGNRARHQNCAKWSTFSPYRLNNGLRASHAASYAAQVRVAREHFPQPHGAIGGARE
jgi:hypothetical protein